MTKEGYKTLTDKEKVDWLEIFHYEAGKAIRRFVDKLESVEISYRYTGDKLDGFMRLEAAADRMKQKQGLDREIKTDSSSREEKKCR